VAEFVRRVAQSIFYYGDAFYEVIPHRSEAGDITKIELFLVYPPSIKRFFGMYFQVVPWSAAKYARIKAGIRRIPRASLLHITLPNALGGRATANKLWSRLASLSSVIIPEFQMESMGKNIETGFDLNSYIKDRYIEKARLTRELGWNQRKVPDNEVLEFYVMHRHFKFAHSQAVIREHILEVLNEALNRPHVAAGAKIVFENILNDALPIFRGPDLFALI
jgi:hypothetical protein